MDSQAPQEAGKPLPWEQWDKWSFGKTEAEKRLKWLEGAEENTTTVTFEEYSEMCYRLGTDPEVQELRKTMSPLKWPKHYLFTDDITFYFYYCF